MYFQFFKYFFTYIFFSKTRQKLLFLAIIGLFISTFALLVLQSTMGGLQRNLIQRSYRVHGRATLFFHKKDRPFVDNVHQWLKDKGLFSVSEYEIELLLKHGNYISPVIVHGIDFKTGFPEFLKFKEANSTIIGSDLVHKIKAGHLSEVSLISPSHLDSFLGDVPRQVSTKLADIISTGIPEVDLYHLWTRLSLIQNLTRADELNRIRIYSDYDFDRLKKEIKIRYHENVFLETWEEQNASLVWALGLETTVMLFLFVIMTLLVSISITSGLNIFFDKVKLDIISFWILGASQKSLDKYWGYFIQCLTIVTIAAALAVACGFLYLLDHYGPNLMPDIFIDRKIPVYITPKGIFISFLVPYFISVLFSHLSLRSFKKDESGLLSRVRSVG